MKILLTLDFPPSIGGIQRYLHDIVKHHYGSGDIVLVGAHKAACRGCSAEIRAVPHSLGMLYHKLHLFTLLNRYRALTRSTRSRIITECGNVYAALVPWILRKPYRVYTYGTELCALKNPTPKNYLFRRILNEAEVVYVLGEYTNALLKRAGVFRATVAMPPRIEVQSKDLRSAEQRYSRSCRKLKPLHILSVGRLVEHKGFRLVIGAVAKLPDTCWGKLTIVGSGPNQNILQQQVDSLRLADRISIQGRLTDQQLAAEYTQADAFVLASRSSPRGTEGFGIVLLEAMSHGVPVIASRCGGIPEVLGDCGLLFDEGDEGGLREALCRLSENPELRSRLSSKGLSRIGTRYAW